MKASKLSLLASRGFAIMETLIAATVLATGLLALLSFHGIFLNGLADARLRMEATVLSEAKLQEVQSYLTVADARVSGSDSDCEELVFDHSPYVEFYRCWQVSDYHTPCLPMAGTGGSACPVRAKVSVAWHDRAGDEQQVVLSSIINIKEPAGGVSDLLSVAVSASQYRPYPDWAGSSEAD